MVVRQASFTKHLLSWLKRLLLFMTTAELNKAAVHYTPLLLLIQTFKIFYLQIWSFFCNQNYSLLHIFYIPNTHKSACLNWLFLHLISGKYFIMVTILAVPLNMKVSTRDENIKKKSVLLHQGYGFHFSVGKTWSGTTCESRHVQRHM